MPVDPSTISGLVAWYKADAITGLSDTDPVSTWPDSSGEGNDATQTLTDRPFYRTGIVNSLPAVEFNASGSAQWMATSLVVNTPYTMFAVFKRTADPDNFFARVLFGTNGDRFLGAEELGNGLAFYPTVGGTVAADTWYVVSGIRRASPSPESRLFSGFTQLATSVDTGNFGTLALSPTDASGLSNDRLKGYLAEALVYDEAISDADHEAVIEYLHDKYAFTPLSPPRSGLVYQVYGDFPAIVRTGRVHQVFFSIPDAPRTARIYQLFASIPSLDVAGRVFQVFGRIPSPPSGTGGPSGGDPGEEVVTDFVRQLAPIHSTAYERPRGKQSWGHTGKVQSRAGFSAGMKWTETYEPKRMTDPDFWGFVEYLNELQQNERLFEIALSDIMGRPTLLGTATGTMLVNGADQVGFSLAADGWSGVLKQGDLIRVDGLNYTMVVTADVTATAAIPISPGILSGGSPENDAEIFYGSNLTVRAKIDGLAMPEVDGDQVYAGLRVTFREAP